MEPTARQLLPNEAVLPCAPTVTDTVIGSKVVLESVALKNPATIASSSPTLVRTVVEPLSTVMKSNDDTVTCCCPPAGEATGKSPHANDNATAIRNARRITASLSRPTPAVNLI